MSSQQRRLPRQVRFNNQGGSPPIRSRGVLYHWRLLQVKGPFCWYRRSGAARAPAVRKSAESSRFRTQ